MHKIMVVVVGAFLFIAVVAGTRSIAIAGDGGQNLEVLPKSWTKAELKKYMKSVAASLGVECDHCHNTDDMAADTPKKAGARQMMKMVIELNKNYFKGEQRITCMTCHNGALKPKK